MINNFFQKNKKRGFTLVETLVAISILMISISGPMFLVSNGIRSSAYSRDQITAFYLAQDAIEAMRFIRDNNRIEKVKSANPTSVPWNYLTGLNCTVTPNAPCGVDTSVIYAATNGDYGQGVKPSYASQVLSIKDGIYGYSSDPSATPTTFKRWVTIREVVPDEEVEIIVTVDWSSGGISRTFSVRENLFYWY